MLWSNVDKDIQATRLTHVPAGPVVAALQEASHFLLLYKDASRARRFIQGCELSARAKEILVTLSQALQVVLLQVSVQNHPVRLQCGGALLCC